MENEKTKHLRGRRESTFSSVWLNFEIPASAVAEVEVSINKDPCVCVPIREQEGMLFTSVPPERGEC